MKARRIARIHLGSRHRPPQAQYLPRHEWREGVARRRLGDGRQVAGKARESRPGDA